MIYWGQSFQGKQEGDEGEDSQEMVSVTASHQGEHWCAIHVPELAPP